MKLKAQFVLHAMGEDFVAAPVGESTKKFQGIIRLNSSSAYLWRRLEEEPTREALVEALVEKYEITRALAESEVTGFVEKLEKAGVLETS